MSARTMDAGQSFTFLADNVPLWITRVTDLASHAAAKHAEFTAEYAKLSAEERNPPRRRKNSSMNTNRDDDEDDDEEHQKKRPHSNSAEKQQQQDDADAADPLTLLRLSRDRKKEAKKSKNAIPARYQVVVHYDGHTQRTLEVLVRDMGGARNNIRKGRMNQMMKKGIAFKTAFSTHQLDDPTQPVFRSSRLNFLKDQGSDGLSFDEVDKHLDAVQSLCESAAHLFLRYGDCVMELNKTKEHLESVLQIAKSELERLKRETKDTPKDEETVECRPQTQMQEAFPMKSDKNPEMGVIEVDDGSDASSISIDMAALRSSRFRV